MGRPKTIRAFVAACLAILCVATVALAAQLPSVVGDALPSEPRANAPSVGIGEGFDESDGNRDALGESAPRQVADGEMDYRSDEVLVRIPEDLSLADFNEQIEALGTVRSASIGESDSVLGWASLELAEGASVEQALRELQDSGIGVEAQPNFVYHVLDGQASADGPAKADSSGGALAGLAAGASGGLSSQAVSDDKLVGENEAWMGAVHIAEAWERVRCDEPPGGGAPVTVAVVDTGCDVGHPDLAQNIVEPFNATDGSADVTDGNGHGTHVAGLISAVADNGVGIAGVSHNARIMPVKVVEKGSTTSTLLLLKAYEHVMNKAEELGIRIMNVSLGGAGGYDSAALRAIDEAYWDHGILSVFAAGNEDVDNGVVLPCYYFPCDYAEVGLGVVNVAGRGPDDDEQDWKAIYRSSSSNYNKGHEKTKSLSAPGVDLLSTYPRSKSASGGAPKGYRYISGTSMATPVVSGIAALALTANPDLTSGEVKSLLCSTAQDIVYSLEDGGESAAEGFDAYTGYGLVRADRVVAEARDSYLTGPEAVAKGASIALSVPDGGQGAWTWESCDPEIATVDAEGRVTGVSHGEAVIRATREGASSRSESDGELDALCRTVVVYEPKIVGAGSLTVGDAKSLKFTSGTLSMCEWSSSDKTVAKVGKTTGLVSAVAPGTVTIRATLTAAPNISVSKRVTVKPDIASARVRLAKTSYTYSNKVVTPKIASVVLDGAKLVQGRDYTVSYDKGRKRVGTYSVHLKGKGVYGGSATATFKIAKAINPLSVKGRTKTVRASSLKSASKVLPGALRLSVEGRGAVTFAKVASASSKQLSIGKKSGVVTVKRKTARGVYKMKVRVRASGTANYKAKTRTVTVTVKVV